MPHSPGDTVWKTDDPAATALTVIEDCGDTTLVSFATPDGAAQIHVRNDQLTTEEPA